MNVDYDRLALHFKYSALIALLLLIAVATDRWSAKPDFTTYLSNAATMTSLLLGVVAIFYSFISNDSMSRSLGSISTVSADVQAARHDIAQFVDTTKNTNETAASNLALVRDSSDALGASLAQLEQTLGKISEKNESLQTLVASLPTRFDQLESKVGDVAKAIGEKPQQAQPAPTPDDISPKVIGRFLGRSSLTQNLLTYACVLASTTGKPLSIPLFSKAIGSETPSAFNGFMGCMQALQLCVRKAAEGQDRTYLVTSLHPELATQTKSYYTSYIENTYRDKPMERVSWLTKLEAVDSLFGESTQ